MRVNYTKQVAGMLTKDKEVNFENVKDLLCFNDLCPEVKCPFQFKGDRQCGHLLNTMIMTSRVRYIIDGE